MARLLGYEGPELTLTMAQATYITKAVDQGWSEDFYGGTVYLSVQAKRNGGKFDFVFGKSVQKGAAFAGEEFARRLTATMPVSDLDASSSSCDGCR